MIEDPTVFILGAGASMPYGFPSGAELRTQICGAVGDHSLIYKTLSRTLGFSTVEVRRFADQFLRSGQASIDAFLSRRSEFACFGKRFVAIDLISREIEANLFRPNIEDDWYGLLWNALQRDAKTLQHVITNRVRIITFNYDRSLEHYLFQAVQHTFGATNEAALAVVESFGILHVYGLLGDYSPTPKKGARTYCDALTTDAVNDAAAGIRIIPEARDSDTVFEEARNHVRAANRVCFLGFGFDFLNLERLSLRRLLDKTGRKPNFVVSTLEKTSSEIEAYRARICPFAGPSSYWRTFNAINSMTIRESGVLL